MAPLDNGALFARRYRVVRLIATGGMGAVYEVVHLETDRRRALKVLHPEVLASADQVERFKREARIAGSIESEFIVDVFDAGVDEPTGMPYLVMELLRGEDLGQRLSRLGKLSPAEVIETVRQTALALEKTHRARVVHRDLKPRNLFLAEREDGPPRVVVLDFGIAKIVAQEASSTATQVLGTLLYMAPEQLDEGGRITPAVDIHALGMVAYTLLVGSHYYEDEHRELGVLALAAVIGRGPRARASERAAARGVALPAAFDAWFARAVAVSPSDRFPTALDAARALAQAFGAPAEPTPPPARPARARRPLRRAIVAPAVCAILALGLARALGPARHPTPRRPACTTTEIACGERCADPSTDPENCGACGHGCLGGACEAGACQPIALASDQHGPIDITTDGTHVYWITRGSTDHDGAVMMARKDGSSVTVIARGQDQPSGMAVDDVYVYWVSSGDGTVARAPIDGGEVEVLATGQREPRSVAVGELGIYWTNRGSGTLSFLGDAGEVLVLVSGLHHPGDLAIDDVNVYCADRGGRRLLAVSIRGEGQRVLANGPETPVGIAVDATSVYWVEYDGGRVMSAPLRGGNPTVIASGERHPLAVAVDESYVYWTSQDDGTVMAKPIGRGHSRRLCSGQEWPASLALDAESIYWVNEKGGQVMRLPKLPR